MEQMIYFTSDTHFGHTNVIRFDKRPFASIDEHDDTLVRNWNTTVSNDDTIYFLGDFALCSQAKLNNIMYQLNGNKYFIKGNHDKPHIVELYKRVGTYLGEFYDGMINNQRITLCHYAMRTWNKSHHGSWHLYGHSHHSLPDNPNSLSIDVGTNGWDYKPLSFDEISTLMSKKTYKPIDHHGTNSRIL